MKKITIDYDKKNFSFGVDKIKYLIGNNYEMKHTINKVIKSVFEKESVSEYSQEENYYYNFKINDSELSLRNYKLIKIDETFCLTQEEKIGSKSLYRELLETKFREIEYLDICNTISILQNDLAEEMNNELSNINSRYKLNLEFEELSIRSIIKQLIIYNTLKEKRINILDFSYEELLIYQIELLTEVVNNNDHLHYIVLMNIPLLTKSIVDTIDNVKNNNLSIIATVTSVSDGGIINNNKQILLLNKQIIDLANDIEIFDKIIKNLNEHVTIEEANEIINEYLMNKNTDRINYIRGYL